MFAQLGIFLQEPSKINHIPLIELGSDMSWWLVVAFPGGGK